MKCHHKTSSRFLSKILTLFTYSLYCEATLRQVGAPRGRSTHLWSKHKRLHELPHGLTIVRQFSEDLYHHSIAQCGMSIHVPDLCVAFTKLQRHDLLVDFLKYAGRGEKKKENEGTRKIGILFLDSQTFNY